VNLRPPSRFLRNGWVLVGVFAIAGVALAGGYLAAQAPQYESTAKMFVLVPPSPTRLFYPSGHPPIDHDVVAGYAGVARTTIVLNPVIADLGLNENASSLASRIAVETESDSAIMDIRTTDPSPLRAAMISNAVTQQLANVVNRLSPTGQDLSAPSPTGPASTGVKLTRVRSAAPASAPTTRNALATLVVGLIAGTALGMLVAAFRDSFGGGRGGIRRIPGVQLT